jgi:bacterioferritin-associated ferredoxin
MKSMGLETCAVVATPSTKQEMRLEGEKELEERDAGRVRSGIGAALFIAQERADIQYAVKEAARGMARPTQGDLVRLKRVGRYIAGKKYMETSLCPDLEKSDMLEVYVDADWATDKKTRKSTSCGMLFYAGVMIMSYSRTQGSIALSSGEAELYAIGSGTCEGLHVKMLLEELGDIVKLEVYSDSTAGISAQSRLGMGKMKHVQLRNLFVQDKVRAGDMRLLKVGTDDNVSDIGTKPVDQKTLEKHLVSIGMAPTAEQHVHSVEGAVRRDRVKGSSELAKLAALLSQCGSCLTTLSGMIPGVKAEDSVAIVGKEIVERCHSDPWSYSALVLCLLSLVLVFSCCEMRCRCCRRARSVGTQTDDGATMAERTMESLRSEARRLDLAAGGTKSEMIDRLIRHRHRG